MIQLHIAWGKSFIILLDGDSEGLKQRERYIQIFGPIVAGKCMLLRDVCHDPSVKECEDLLDATDKEVIISAIFPPEIVRRSTKKVLREAIMELYARRETVTFDSATLARFDVVFEELARRLNSQSA